MPPPFKSSRPTVAHVFIAGGHKKAASAKSQGTRSAARVFLWVASHVFQMPWLCALGLAAASCVFGYYWVVFCAFNTFHLRVNKKVRLFYAAGLFVIVANMLFALYRCKTEPRFSTVQVCKAIEDVSFLQDISSLLCTAAEDTSNSPELIRGIFEPSTCLICRTKKVAGVHHCSHCNSCRIRWSHYCDWIDECIDAYNYRFYLQLLFWGFVACGWTAASVFYHHCWSTASRQLRLLPLIDTFGGGGSGGDRTIANTIAPSSKRPPKFWQAILIWHFAALTLSTLCAISLGIVVVYKVSLLMQNVTFLDRFGGTPNGIDAFYRWLGAEPALWWAPRRLQTIARLPFEWHKARNSRGFLWSGLYEAADQAGKLSEIKIALPPL